MKIHDFWKQHEEYTKETSTIARQLAFGAVAIAWIFKSPERLFPKPILYALIFVVAFFFVDLL